MSTAARRREALKRVSHETTQAIRISQLAAMEASVPARGYPQDCIDLAERIADKNLTAIFGPLPERDLRMVRNRMPWQELTLPDDKGTSRAVADLTAGERFAARRATYTDAAS